MGGELNKSETGNARGKGAAPPAGGTKIASNKSRTRIVDDNHMVTSPKRKK